MKISFNDLENTNVSIIFNKYILINDLSVLRFMKYFKSLMQFVATVCLQKIQSQGIDTILSLYFMRTRLKTKFIIAMLCLYCSLLMNHNDSRLCFFN